MKRKSISMRLMLSLLALCLVPLTLAGVAAAEPTPPAASYWYTGSTPSKLIGSKNLQCRIKAGTKLTYTLHLYNLKSDIVMRASGFSCPEGKITQTGTTATLVGKIALTGLEVVSPSGCKVQPSLNSNMLTAGFLQEGTSSFLRFQPSSGVNLWSLTITGCVFSGTYTTTGSFTAQTNPAGVMSSVQPMILIGGEGLRAQEATATLVGTIETELLAGERFGWKES